MAMHTMLFHQGMVLVGLPYTAAGQMTLDEITGGSPYGVSTIAGGKGQRQPSANELGAARFQAAISGGGGETRGLGQTGAGVAGAIAPGPAPPSGQDRAAPRPRRGASA